MRVQSIDSSALPIIEYRHIHDATIVLRKYRENFNFGLITNQYYFNEKLKDKKTNFNTQYQLTDLQALSTIAELDIPFTTNAVSAFTTTIKQNGKYLKTDYKTNINSISSTFVDSSQFSNLSSEFFFTFHVSSVSANNTLNRQDTVFISQEYDSTTYYLSAPLIQDTTALWTDVEPSYFNYALDDNKKLIISNSETSNVLINTDTSFLDVNPITPSVSGNYADASHWTNRSGSGGGLGDSSGWHWGATAFATHVVASGTDNLYQNVNTILGNNYEVTLTISGYAAGTVTVFIGTTDGVVLPTENGTHTVIVDSDNNIPNRLYIQASASFVGTVSDISVVMIPQSSLHWKSPGTWQSAISDLSASFLDVNRNLLTKDFKTLPNTFNKYKSSSNVDNVSLTNVTSVSNNYFVFNNNYNFYQDNSENKFIAHVDLFH